MYVCRSVASAENAKVGVETNGCVKRRVVLSILDVWQVGLKLRDGEFAVDWRRDGGYQAQRKECN